MKTKLSTIMGAIALIIALTLNASNSINDYGVKESKLLTEALAESNDFIYSTTGNDDDGIEVVIECGRYRGRCNESVFWFSGEYTIPCRWTGLQQDYCIG